MNRKRSAGLTVLLATDGSRQAHAALALAAAFPWADAARAHMVLARGGIPLGPWPAEIWVAGISDVSDQALEREISRARRLVRHRWPDVTVSAMNTPPIETITEEARRRRAGVIVVGSRGLGFARRLMLGSVSRGVVRRAGCPVLVVKSRRRRVRRLVLATDGSRNASRALGFLLTRLKPPAGARVKVMCGSWIRCSLVRGLCCPLRFAERCSRRPRASIPSVPARRAARWREPRSC
jgi:nucleotide-binding universal stress UspA family protein